MGGGGCDEKKSYLRRVCIKVDFIRETLGRMSATAAQQTEFMRINKEQKYSPFTSPRKQETPMVT